MKIKMVIMRLPVSLILVSCGSTIDIQPTNTFTPEPVLLSSPTLAPTITITPSRTAIPSQTRVDLSSELYLDEHSSPENLQGERDLDEYGHFFNNSGMGFMTVIGTEQWVAGMTDGQLLPFDDSPALPVEGQHDYSIQLWQDGEMLYSLPVDGIGPEPKRILRYDDHWIFWFMDDWENQGWVVQDGVSLNELHEYDSAFSLFLLDDKPFFFFRRGEQFGISFDGEEISLPYSNISYGPICCENGGSGRWNPRGTNRMVGFYIVLENSQREYVEIGLK